MSQPIRASTGYEPSFDGAWLALPTLTTSTRWLQIWTSNDICKERRKWQQNKCLQLNNQRSQRRRVWRRSLRCPKPSEQVVPATAGHSMRSATEERRTHLYQNHQAAQQNVRLQLRSFGDSSWNMVIFTEFAQPLIWSSSTLWTKWSKMDLNFRYIYIGCATHSTSRRL